MRLLDLFSGIGGFSLAAEWVWGDELEIVAFVENDKFCQKVLHKHWPNVSIIEDIRDVKEETITNAPSQRWNRRGQNSNRLQSGLSWARVESSKSRNIDLITGGFPCQPFSQAGKRTGKSDNRYLWPEMFRVIRKFKPTWVVAENVVGINSMVEFDMCLEMDDKIYTKKEMAEGSVAVGRVCEREGRGILDEIMADLKKSGYVVQPFVIGAVSVDAKHRRLRVWIVAYSGHRNRRSEKQKTDETQVPLSSQTSGSSEASRSLADTENHKRGIIDRNSKKDVADTDRDGTEWDKPENGQGGGLEQNSQGNWPDEAEWFAKSGMGRVASRIPNRVDRLKCLGNAIVPQVAEQIFRTIKAIDEQNVSGEGGV